MEAFREASAGIERVREAMNRFREAMQNELPVAEAVKAVLGTMAVRALETGASFKDVAEQAKDMRQAMLRFNEIVLAGMPVQEAEALILKDLAASFEAEAIAANSASGGTSTAAAGAGAGAGGFLAMAAGVLAVVVAVQVLLPPLLLVIGALATLTSFAVAGAGMIALLGAIGVAIGGLGAATLALGIGGMGGTGAAANLATATANLQKAEAAIANAGGASISQGAQNRLANAQRALAQWNALHQGTLTQAQQFTQQNLESRVAQAQQGMVPTGGATQTQIQNLAHAQAAYNAALAQSHTPISIFLAHLTEMKQDFEKAAEPFAKLILQFADKALPAIEKLGMGLLSWFGARIPGILAQIGRIVKDLGPDFATFGKFLGDLFDRNEGKIAPMAEAFIRFGLSLATGLLSTLERLSNWFMERLPTYGPVVKDILGKIGGVILAVAGAFGHFADFVVKNWPTWMKEIGDAWNKPGANGKSLGQNLQDTANNDLPQLKTSFEEIMKQAPVWLPVISGLAQVFLNLATAVLQSVSAGEKLVSLLQQNPWLGGPLGYALPGASIPGAGSKPSDNFTKSGYNSRGGRQSAVVINVNGAKNPEATGKAVANHLRRLTQV